ncbi:FUSC family protein [Saccharopolyspora sp. HNM0986]|uniref:FUSC family protein n=1 Tax=Saccharopolyspora galaxeae TaxID=2781241 RepID=UPI00190C7FE5|nr:aromatic acid exporter family protein [Saccharopolyspora sp. HNM0986]MBK0868880.1 FUSC family protein [Saccharopolyspora sp. HNM0986]
MTGGDTTGRTAVHRAKERAERLIGTLRRGLGHAGRDRDAMLSIVKSVFAAAVAWLIANNLLHAPSATFAPFTALLMVQATVSQSVDQSARYAAAMVAGVVLAGVLTPTLGAAMWTFAVLILVALVFGRWRKLGQQGPQVGVAALFAYSSFTQSPALSASYLQLASIAGLVLLGCALGVLTNLVIVPPMRYRSAEHGIGSLAHSLCDLLTDVSEGLHGGVPDRESAQAWQHRADQLPESVAQARATVEHAAETMRFNPRRLFMRDSTSFAGHRTILNALERAGEQLNSGLRGVHNAAATDHPQDRAHHRFIIGYAELLAAAAEAARNLGRLHSADDTPQLRELDDATSRAERAYRELAEQAGDETLDSPRQWPIYGALQTDAHRLVEEFIHARHSLSHLLEPDREEPQTAGSAAERSE